MGLVCDETNAGDSLECIEDEYDCIVADEAYDDYVKSGYKSTPAAEFWKEFEEQA